MSKNEQFLDFVQQTVEERIKTLDLSEPEAKEIQDSLYDIFKSNYDLEAIYYQLLDYLEKQEKLRSLIPKIEMYYLNSLN